MTYMIGYSGKTVTRAELLAWSKWQGIDDEMARRLLAFMDASIAAGRPVGIGGAVREDGQQDTLFFSRYVPDDDGDYTGSTWYQGQWWELLPGMAPAAPGGRSYHERLTLLLRCLAVDLIGDLDWARDNVARFGLLTFHNIGTKPEPWHTQPVEIPTSRSRYVRSLHEPLPVFTLPHVPPPGPSTWDPFVPGTKRDLRLTSRHMKGADVTELQSVMVLWKAYPARWVDGDFGTETDKSLRKFQIGIGAKSDGWWGPQSRRLYREFVISVFGSQATA